MKKMITITIVALATIYASASYSSNHSKVMKTIDGAITILTNYINNGDENGQNAGLQLNLENFVDHVKQYKTLMTPTSGYSQANALELTKVLIKILRFFAQRETNDTDPDHSFITSAYKDEIINIIRSLTLIS